MVMATLVTVMRWLPLLMKKVTAVISRAPLFHGQASRMLDGVVKVRVGDVGRLWNPTGGLLMLWKVLSSMSASMRA